MATFSHAVPFKSAGGSSPASAPATTVEPADLPAFELELPKPSSSTPQVVYAPGKAPQAVAAALQALLQRQRVAIAVKVDAAMHNAVAELLPGGAPAPRTGTSRVD
jgi:thiamine pyrophosphate-dependent acetolactate synthase large subunit-like protein